MFCSSLPTSEGQKNAKGFVQITLTSFKRVKGETAYPVLPGEGEMSSGEDRFPAVSLPSQTQIAVCHPVVVS